MTEVQTCCLDNSSIIGSDFTTTTACCASSHWTLAPTSFKPCVFFGVALRGRLPNQQNLQVGAPVRVNAATYGYFDGDVFPAGRLSNSIQGALTVHDNRFAHTEGQPLFSWCGVSPAIICQGCPIPFFAAGGTNELASYTTVDSYTLVIHYVL